MTHCKFPKLEEDFCKFCHKNQAFLNALKQFNSKYFENSNAKREYLENLLDEIIEFEYRGIIKQYSDSFEDYIVKKRYLRNRVPVFALNILESLIHLASLDGS